MYTRILRLTAIAGTIALLQSCAAGNAAKSDPILLGDSATIVTETDPQYLQDFVPVPEQPAKPAEAPAEVPRTDTVAVAVTAPPEPTPEEKKEKPEEEETAVEAPKGSGLAVVFKQMSVFVPDIKTRTYKKQDTRNASSVTYELTSGTLNGKQIKISGGTVQRITQRCQAIAVAKNDLGTLPLESLTATSGWEALKGSKNTYTIAGLTAAQLPAPRVTASAIRAAVTKAARAMRINKATEQKWQNALKSVRSAKQKPLRVALRSVTWKIEGKDAAGKAYTKQVRIDIPAS